MKWVVVSCLIAAAGWYAYDTGSRLARSEVAKLEQQIASLSASMTDLKQQSAEQQAEIEAERAHAEQWRQRYEQEVPTGDLKNLFDLVRGKLDSGLSVERLGFVINAAEDRDHCTADPVTKRFLVQTPLYKGPDDSLRFAEGAIVVTASGVSARDGAGNPEAWFDPAEPVTFLITHISGKRSEFSGRLPLHHSVVANDKEFRFNFTVGNRGFVQVTGQECRYP
jgi:hypothetical protein